MATQVKANSRLNTTDLIQVVAERLGVDEEEGRKAVLAVLGTISDVVAFGGHVAVTNFGSFSVKAITGVHNPHTLEKLPDAKGIRFLPSDTLRDAVRAGRPLRDGIAKRSGGSR